MLDIANRLRNVARRAKAIDVRLTPPTRWHAEQRARRTLTWVATVFVILTFVMTGITFGWFSAYGERAQNGIRAFWADPIPQQSHQNSAVYYERPTVGTAGPLQPSPWMDEYADNKFVGCKNGASLRLLDKWLQIPHDGKLADRCVPFNDVVLLVQQELPRLKASIDEHNRQVDTEWDAFKLRVQKIAQWDDHLAAAHRLWDMRCGGEQLMKVSGYQWTLFLDSTPDAVRKALGQLYFIDEHGYGDKVTELQHDGKTEIEYAYDQYYYDAAIKNGPLNRGDDASEGNYRFKVYGFSGDVPAGRLIEATYESVRLLTSSQDLPMGLIDSNPVCLDYPR